MDSSVDIDAVRRRLLAHYDAHARPLPWRVDASPYRTWVSEVMLQQTRVDAVVPYFERWVERFPDVDALADADESDVLRAWEGLGYYSRARNLHSAARLVRERFGGRVPSDYDRLRELPGVGDYTAGAVASIAYGRAEPAVDGNVRRVLARLLDLEGPTPSELRAAAATLVPDDRPGDFNQALMELGATICTPRSPACERCPLSSNCLARARGTVALRPAPRRRGPVPSFDMATLVVLDSNSRLLLRRRPDSGLLARMWEFPNADAAGEELEDVARRLAAELLGAEADTLEFRTLDPVPHVFSHRREVYHPFVLQLPWSDAAGNATRARERGARTADARRAWVASEALRDYPMPRAQRRIQALALGRGVRLAVPAKGQGRP